MVQNVYKYVFNEQSSEIESAKVNECASKTADILGISQRVVFTTLKEHKENQDFKAPEKPGPKHNFKDKLDDFTLSAIRRKVYGFYAKNEAPTIKKVLKSVNDDVDLPNFSWSTMRKTLLFLNFKFITKSRRSALIDREDIVLWRQKYINQIKEYRRQNSIAVQKKYIYYQDETWLNEGHTTSRAWVDTTITSSRQAFMEGLTTGLKSPTGKGKRIIISHIGGEEGFVENGLMLFEAKKGSEDYHQEMNAECFEDWFRDILPKLKKDSVVVFDNAPYHSRKIETLPTMSWTKPRIQEWLTSKEIQYEEKIIKATLIDIVRQHKDQFPVKYTVDEMAKEQGITILRLPPYHIEMVWAQAKGHVARSNKTFKMDEVKTLFKEPLTNITQQKWKSCVTHVIKVEDDMYHLDPRIDGVVDRLIINITESDSDDDYDSE